ncbi:hypothetical protein K435DRAFT_861803 [Dendrothele bispora CBS 962.96]|uniref:Uncharacterized protein n=1 Tax=Dendrothele bispora (strain CBS 962.96) TaxID=1314807 RepID=A0A4S8LU99_DENBC|nr:hypothetical protein K435DRAFT_861803 [Dendrothele bispora CBS 962.96]
MSVQQVQPRQGRFSWSTVDLQDPTFVSDPRRGFTPPIFRNHVNSTSQVNYRFYLTVTGAQPGIYFDWGYLQQSIDVRQEQYKGFNSKADILATHRWYCLHYHRHSHDSDYDSFEYPFTSPLSSPIREPETLTPSPNKSPTRERSASPSKHPKSPSSKSIGFPTQRPHADPFTLMGNAFYHEETQCWLKGLK